MWLLFVSDNYSKKYIMYKVLGKNDIIVAMEAQDFFFFA